MVCEQSGPMQNNGEIIVVAAVQRSISLSTAALPNEHCSRQALFGCGFAAMVVTCLQLNLGVRRLPTHFFGGQRFFD